LYATKSPSIFSLNEEESTKENVNFTESSASMERGNGGGGRRKEEKRGKGMTFSFLGVWKWPVF
jgi:hypothetical protein